MVGCEHLQQLFPSAQASDCNDCGRTVVRQKLGDSSAATDQGIGLRPKYAVKRALDYPRPLLYHVLALLIDQVSYASRILVSYLLRFISKTPCLNFSPLV